MTKNDFEQFSELWATAAELYGKTPSDSAVMMAFAALQRFELGQVSQALSKVISTSKFLPKPADIVEIIVGDADSLALLAWDKFISALGKVGTYRSITFDDPRIMMCIDRLGGWVALGNETEDELKFKKHDFLRLYKGFMRNPANYPKYLIGISQASNAQAGVDYQEPPVLFGDQEQALLVQQHGGQAASLPNNHISSLLGNFERKQLSNEKIQANNH